MNMFLELAAGKVPVWQYAALERVTSTYMRSTPPLPAGLLAYWLACFQKSCVPDATRFENMR